LLSYLRAARSAGRRIGLFTGADQSIADSVAAHLGLFDVVKGSDGAVNLSGKAKQEAIADAFGSRFAYAGDARVDRPVFDAAESVILVGPVDRLRGRLKAGKRVEATFPKVIAGSPWIEALRLPHWVKNLLVFVAPVLGAQGMSLAIASQTILLFLLMGVIASATYVVNDLLDLSADRRHPKKRFRPFAAGTLSVRSGVAVATTMLLGGFAAAAALLPFRAVVCMGAYLAVTLAYSLLLKREPMVDVVALAGLFTLRVATGGVLLPGPVSPWLLTFSMLFFLNLAMIKRYAELERVLRVDGPDGRARGYSGPDLPILLATGLASGLSAIVIFMIYLINEQYPRHFYGQPQALWGVMPLLLIWTLRVWRMSAHGRMNEDPVIFALKDTFSLALGASAALVMVIAWI
jgi:4-hydroxybenzoate polyprenyltransferase